MKTTDNPLKPIEEFLLSRCKAETAKAYLRDISFFLHEHPEAKDFGHKEMNEYLHKLRGRYTNKDSPARILCGVKKYYDYLLFTGQRDTHPCHTLFIKGKRGRDVPHEKLLTPDELELLLQREDRYTDLALRNKLIMSLLVHQGLTTNNISHLRLKDIDFDRGTIYLMHQTKVAPRTLLLKPGQVKMLLDYIDGVRVQILERKGTKTDRVFVNLRGRPESPCGIAYLIETFKGMFPDKNVHSELIRMSVIANKLNIEKRPLGEVQDFAGHSYASTTERYRKPDEVKGKEIINQFHPLNTGR